jgi:hypothetical protein
MTHEIKCWPQWFNMLIARSKGFELRKDDRKYEAGDTLREREYDPITKTFTGRVAICRVTCKLDNFTGLVPGYCVLGIFFEHMEVPKHAPEAT